MSPRPDTDRARDLLAALAPYASDEADDIAADYDGIATQVDELTDRLATLFDDEYAALSPLEQGWLRVELRAVALAELSTRV